jgi:hypothetical protein
MSRMSEMGGNETTRVFAVLQKFKFFFFGLTWMMPRQRWMDAGWPLRITRIKPMKQ